MPHRVCLHINPRSEPKLRLHVCICVSSCMRVSPFPLVWDWLQSCGLRPTGSLSATTLLQRRLRHVGSWHWRQASRTHILLCTRNSRDLLFWPLTSTPSPTPGAPSFGVLPVLQCNFFKDFSASSQWWRPRPDHQNQKICPRKGRPTEVILNFCWN